MLATDMRLVGYGALASPDTPATEISFVGELGGRPAMVTVILTT